MFCLDSLLHFFAYVFHKAVLKKKSYLRKPSSLSPKVSGKSWNSVFKCCWPSWSELDSSEDLLFVFPKERLFD